MILAESVWFLMVGMMVTISAVAIARICEQRWFAPSILFFWAFLFHGFVDPLVRLGSDPVLDRDSMGTVMRFTELCAVGLLVGYGIVQTWFELCVSDSRQQVSRPRPLWGAIGMSLAAVLAMAVTGSMFFVTVSSGGLVAGKGHVTYQGGAIRQLILMNTLIYPIIGALYMGVWSFERRARRLAIVLVGMLVMLIAIQSIMQFGRMAIVTTGLLLFVLAHGRFSPLRLRHFVTGGAVLGLVSIISLGRRLNEGLLNLAFVDVWALATELVSSPLDVLAFAATSIPGQAVFSRVIEYVPIIEPHRWGMTYVESLRGVFAPNILTGVSNPDTPAHWFKDMYAPGILEHGFDFSMIAEAYLNFGWFGPVVFLLVGAVVAWLSRIVMASRSPLLVLWSAIMIVNLVIGLRNDSNAVIKRAVFFTLPVIGVVLLDTLARAAMRRMVIARFRGQGSRE